MSLTFCNEERLCSKKIISRLMSLGKSQPVKGDRFNPQAANVFTMLPEENIKSPSPGSLGGAEFFPVRIIWMETELPCKFPVQVLISVPKKKIKTSVQRNRIKRIIRESYRKNKNLLYEKLINSGKKIALAIIYTSSEESNYSEIERKIILSLHRLVAVI